MTGMAGMAGIRSRAHATAQDRRHRADRRFLSSLWGRVNVARVARRAALPSQGPERLERTCFGRARRGVRWRCLGHLQGGEVQVGRISERVHGGGPVLVDDPIAVSAPYRCAACSY